MRIARALEEALAVRCPGGERRRRDQGDVDLTAPHGVDGVRAAPAVPDRDPRVRSAPVDQLEGDPATDAVQVVLAPVALQVQRDRPVQAWLLRSPHDGDSTLKHPMGRVLHYRMRVLKQGNRC